ncbi:O-antigen polymerase [Aliarcobacter skirrowii]|uniref:O-antigen polymerase n=1 Tax=Aliarcobacter skirrowii TaxID=28200 RepID=UPI0013E8F9D2|nr:O-antigen polymerase [Aliarcobacter skirrowii]
MFFKTRRYTNPLGLILLIWGTFLILSNFSITGLYIPSYYTQIIVILGLISSVVGALLTNVKKESDKKEESLKEKKLFIFVFLFAGISILFLLYKAIDIFLSYNTLKEYIMFTKASEEGDIALYGTGYLLGYINNITVAIIYSSLFISTSMFMINGKKKLFIFSFILIAIYTIILSAREGFVLVILAIFMGVLMKYVNTQIKFKYIKKYLFIVLLALLFVFLVSITRGGMDIMYLINRYIITYHTLGFTMLDLEIQNEYSYLNQNFTYGRASFGFLEQFIAIYTKLIDRDLFTALFTEVRHYVQLQNIVGEDKKGYMRFNAYYTSLYPMYLDFRLYGVIFICGLYGYFITKFYLKWKINSSIYGFTMVLFLFYVGYASILMPVMLRPFFWPSFFIILIYYKYKILINFFQSKKYRNKNKLSRLK